MIHEQGLHNRFIDWDLEQSKYLHGGLLQPSSVSLSAHLQVSSSLVSCLQSLVLVLMPSPQVSEHVHSLHVEHLLHEAPKRIKEDSLKSDQSFLSMQCKTILMTYLSFYQQCNLKCVLKKCNGVADKF